MKKILIFVLLCTVWSPYIYAHKVNIFAYVEGDTVYTESYFPDGKKVQNGIVKVYDSENQFLLKGNTDKEGIFNFKGPKTDKLKIVLEASLGHRAEYEISTNSISQEVNKPKNKISVRDIIAGIGYIFGITGIAMYILNKREQDASS